MRCQKCGKTFDDNSMFCNTCGTKLVEDATEPINIKANNKLESFADQLKNSINESAGDKQFDSYEEPEIDDDFEEAPKKKKS